MRISDWSSDVCSSDLSDVVVVGGGVVGAACTLALAGLDLDVTLVEAAGPAHWSPSPPDLRVFAFAPDNAALLDSFGIWREVLDARAQPYRRMQIGRASSRESVCQSG